MQHAYPADELKPLTCTGLCKSTEGRVLVNKKQTPTRSHSPIAARDGTQDEHEINDVMGGYALTLIDALDSFVVLGDKDGFDRSVRLVVDDIRNFDIDARVQVFEVTIRVLGGLVRLTQGWDVHAGAMLTHLTPATYHTPSSYPHTSLPPHRNMASRWAGTRTNSYISHRTWDSVCSQLSSTA